MRGRRLRTLFISVVAGAIVTFVVAAGCALLFEPFAAQASPIATRIGGVHRWWVGTWDRGGSSVVVSIYDKPTNPALGRPGGSTIEDVRRHQPPWAPDFSTTAFDYDSHLSPPPILDEVRSARATGWPFLAMRGTVDAGTPAQFTAAIPTGTLDKTMWRRTIPRFIPIAPIPSGFVTNTMFYGAITYALLTMLGRVRRGWRAAAAACIFCGYPLRGTTRCSECGREAPVPGTNRPLTRQIRRAVLAMAGGLGLMLIVALTAALYGPVWKTQPPAPTTAQLEFWESRERQLRPLAQRAIEPRCVQLVGPGVTILMEEGVSRSDRLADRFPIGRVYTIESGWPLRCFAGSHGILLNQGRIPPKIEDIDLLRPRLRRIGGAGSLYWRGIPTRVSIGPLLVNVLTSAGIVWCALAGWALVLWERERACLRTPRRSPIPPKQV